MMFTARSARFAATVVALLSAWFAVRRGQNHDATSANRLRNVNMTGKFADQGQASQNPWVRLAFV